MEWTNASVNKSITFLLSLLSLVEPHAGPVYSVNMSFGTSE